MTQSAPSQKPAEFEFTISRVFDAPRLMVWKAWTQQKQLDQWFGPKGCPIIKSTLDLREGGSFLYGMKTPGGDMWGKWTFLTVDEPEKLIFITSFCESTGKTVTRHPFSPSWPLETLSTVTFTEKNKQTEVIIRWTAHNATEIELKTFEEGKQGMMQGWDGTFEQLGEFLAKA